VAKVMVVDDSLFMRMVIKSILVEDGHEIVAEATNGKEAVDKYSQYQPDIVTMDITMPEMNGIQAVREIVSRHPDARIIMCTAMGQHYMVLDAIQAGAKGFIMKPFDKRRVLEEIRKVANHQNVISNSPTCP
jgi:two-component system chemotaxis response regulator CheY